MIPKLVALILALLAASPPDAPPPHQPPAATTEPVRYEYSSALMGVRMTIVLYATDEPLARRAATAAFDRIAEIEQVASTYRPTSELMQLRRRAGEGPIPVSQDLFALLKTSVELNERTDGAFDCTVGHLAERWRRAARTGEPIDHPTPEPEPGRTGDIILHAEDRTVELLREVHLTLDAIAKGYAGDEALIVLREHGVRSALIDLSGDIVLGDPPPARDAWIVTLDFGDPAVPPLRLALKNAAVATSGDTEQFYEIDGVRYSHIIDPRTGSPCTNRSAACVIAPSGGSADALATAACVLGPEAAIPVLAEFDEVHARVRTAQEPDSAPLDARSPGFDRFVRTP